MEKNSELYPSAELMLSVLQKEYEYEINRKNSLESRAGILLTFTGALLVLLSSSLKLPDFNEIEIKTFYEALPYVFILFINIIIIALLIVTIIILFSVISIRTYNRIEIKGFNEANAKENLHIIALDLMKSYKDVLNYNIEVNNKKAKLFNLGVLLITISIIIFSINFFISIFL